MSFLDKLNSMEEGGNVEGTTDAATEILAESKAKAFDKVKNKRRQQNRQWMKEQGRAGLEMLFNPVKQAEKGLDLLSIAKRPLTMYLDDDVTAATSAIQDFLKNPAGGMDSLIRGWNEGQGLAAGREEASREKLGPVESFLAEAGGAVAPWGAVGKLAKLGKHGKQGFFGALRNIGGQGALGSAEAVVAAFNEGERGMGQLGLQALEGSAFGAGGQVLLGELAPRFLKYGLKPDTWSNEKVAERIVDQGMGDGLTPENIRSKYETMRNNDTNIFQEGAGTATGADATERLADAVAEAEFPHAKDATSFQTDRYAQTLAHINQFIDETNSAINSRFQRALEPPKSSFARKKHTDSQLSAARDIYNDIGNMKDGLGAKQISYRDTEASLAESYANHARRGDQKLGSPANSAFPKLYDDVLKIIRPTGQHEHTRGIHRLQHGEGAGEIDLDTANTQLGKLLQARKMLSSKLVPGVNYGDEVGTVSAEMVREGHILMSALDDEIAKHVGDQHGVARGQFAKYMGLEDAETTGMKFYDQRLNEDPTYGRDLEEYMETLSSDPEKLGAFRDGYKRAMARDIERRNATQVMNDLVGTPRKDFDPKAIDKVKTAGWDNLKMVLGEEDAMRLITEHANDADLVEQQGKLRGYFEAKGYNQKAIEGLIRDADDVIIGTGASPFHGNTLNTTGGITALIRRWNHLGVKEADLLTELSGKTGGAGVDAMENMLRAYEKPSAVRMGAGLGAMSGAEGYSEEQLVDPENPERSILDYLNTIDEG